MLFENILPTVGLWKLESIFSLFNLQNKHVREGVAKMSELEDPELTSSYEHTKITIIYRATIDEPSCL